jgi:hypothetical protein
MGLIVHLIRKYKKCVVHLNMGDNDDNNNNNRSARKKIPVTTEYNNNNNNNNNNGTTENCHIAHCTHTSESADVKVH